MKSKIPPIFLHCRRQFYICQLVKPNKSKKEVPAHDGIHQQILEHADSFNKEKPAKTLRQSENHPASPQNQPDLPRYASPRRRYRKGQPDGVESL